MQGFAWGGSEELWCKVADKALDENNEIIISAKQWDNTHPKLQHLIDKGSKCYWRKEENTPTLLKRFIARIRRKVNINASNDKQWDWIVQEKPDVVCINMGGPYEIIYHPGLIEILYNEKIPYFLIQQFNLENFVLSNKSRDIARTAFARAKKLFFVSLRNKETTERNLVTKLSNFKIVSNPANLVDYDAPLFPDEEEGYCFASVARLDAALKGQDMLLQTLSADKWKTRNWKLNFYGSGPSQEYLKELIYFYQLSDKVFLKGSVNNIKEIWSQNHLLVMPSVAEGTPLALIEAMLCARAAVVTDVGGNAFLVNDNVTGFVAAHNSISLLDEAMERAWQKREEWIALGEKARISVLAKVDLESYIDIYKEICLG